MKRLTFVLLNLLICSVYCMDMPLDPANGEMIMTPTYHVNLTNGQQLRFVNKETLNAFLKNPLVGLGNVLMVVNQTSSHPITALCPVCGMNTHAPNGPQVHMQHGDQHIYTCSLHHAHQVHDSFASYSTQESLQESIAAFCTGTGTTMQNGFQWFSNPSSPCILLWFSTWSLNTQYKYLGGCLLIILCAMFNEYLLYLRRVLRKETNYRKGSYRRLEESHGLLGSNSQRSSHHFLLLYFRPLSSETQHVIHSLLHGSTILFAYLLMLVSMTYDGILFGCCILGYILGYYVFGERREKIIEE